MENENQNPEEVKLDAFGEQINPPQPVAPKKEDAAPVDDKDKQIADLNSKIEEIKNEYGGNLKGQREVIAKLENEIKELREKGVSENKDEVNPNLPYPEIKWSKDLTQEEKDEMTDTEIKQMDVIADMQQKQNDLFLSVNKTQETVAQTKVDDLQSLVKSTALTLAENDVDKANQIIEAVKQFNLVGLDEATVIARVQSAQKLLPDYVPPKETNTGVGAGKSVKTDTAADPFGDAAVDAIVDGATTGTDGNYQL